MRIVLPYSCATSKRPNEVHAAQASIIDNLKSSIKDVVVGY